MKHLLLTLAFLSTPLLPPLQAQEGTTVTNAFDDLKRIGSVSEEDSKMRKAASSAAIQKLLEESPAVGYFCFTEDRMNDIRLRDALPEHWMSRTPEERLQFMGECMPGEFYTWQIGVYAPYKTLKDISIRFSDFKSTDGKRIKASSMRCFNLGGTDTNGKNFHKNLHVSKGEIQPLWLGMDMSSAATGTYKGEVTVAADGKPVTIHAEITIQGNTIANRGDDEGWRKTRLRWLDSNIGEAATPTAPYTPVKINKEKISYLGGILELSSSGLPRQIVTQYNQANQLDPAVSNLLLNDESKRLRLGVLYHQKS